jgi:hypothetical protein
MKAGTVWESCKVEGSQLVGKVKELVREGNVRRVVVKQRGRSLVELPLTVGVVGALAAPALAALGALAALLTECTIEIERTEQPPPAKPTRASAARRGRATKARSGSSR